MLKENVNYSVGVLPSGKGWVRVHDMYSAMYADYREHNPSLNIARSTDKYMLEYMRNRLIVTPEKKALYEECRRDLDKDTSFQKLLYKAKSNKKKAIFNKFGGNLSVIKYTRGEDRMFAKRAKSKSMPTIDMAFQVGTFKGGDYKDGIKKIIKIILSAQALGCRVNVDVFDSDVCAFQESPWDGEGGYSIVNLIKSSDKFDLRKFLIMTDRYFFEGTLFNCYGLSNKVERNWGICGYLDEDIIIEDLSERYDVIGGNLTTNNEMKSKLIKIIQ